MLNPMILKKPLIFFILALASIGIFGHFNNSFGIKAAHGSAQEIPKSSDSQYSGQLSREVLSSADYIQQILSAGTGTNLRWQVANLTTMDSGIARQAAYIQNADGDLFYILSVDGESLLITFATRRNVLLVRDVVFKVDNRTVFDVTGQHPIPLVQQNPAEDAMNGLHICVLHGKRNPKNHPLLRRLIHGNTLAIEFYGEQDQPERIKFSLKRSMASIWQVLK